VEHEEVLRTTLYEQQKSVRSLAEEAYNYLHSMRDDYEEMNPPLKWLPWRSIDQMVVYERATVGILVAVVNALERLGKKSIGEKD